MGDNSILFYSIRVVTANSGYAVEGDFSFEMLYPFDRSSSRDDCRTLLHCLFLYRCCAGHSTFLSDNFMKRLSCASVARGGIYSATYSRSRSGFFWSHGCSGRRHRLSNAAKYGRLNGLRFKTDVSNHSKCTAP
jgi:hypothetical protein